MSLAFGKYKSLHPTSAHFRYVAEAAVLPIMSSMSGNHNSESDLVPDIRAFAPCDEFAPANEPKCVIPRISALFKLLQPTNIPDKIWPVEQDKLSDDLHLNVIVAEDKEVHPLKDPIIE